MSDKFTKLITEIETLTVIELNELVNMLQTKWGVSAAVAAPAAAESNAEKPAEKKDFEVILKAAGEKKLDVIKAIRALKPDLSLGDAKKVSETPDSNLGKFNKEKAAEIEKTFKDLGANIVLQ